MSDEQVDRLAEILKRAIDARRKGYDRIALLALDEIVELDDELREKSGGREAHA